MWDRIGTFRSSLLFGLGAVFCAVIYLFIGTGLAAEGENPNTSPHEIYQENTFPTGKTLRVGVSHNPPIGFHWKGGPPQGFIIDIIRYVAKVEGWNLAYIEKPWLELLNLLDAGEIDLLGGIAYTPARAKKYSFSNEAVANNWAVVYRNKDTTINGIEDLDGKRVALIPRNTHTVALKNLAKSFEFGFEEIPAKNYSNILKLVDSGKADVGVVDRTFHIFHGSEYKALATSVNFNSIELRFAAPKGSGNALLSAFDSYLLAQKNDPSSHYRQLMAHWFEGPVEKDVPVLVFWTGFGVAGMLLLSLVFVLLLRRQVEVKTAAARNSERKYRSIFENAFEGIFQSTPDGRFISANPAMARILNYASPDDLMSRVTDIGKQLFCNDNDREACLAALNSDGQFTGKEVQWKRKDGKSVWILESVRSLTNEKGEPYFEGTIQDITELHRAHEELETRVADRTRELSREVAERKKAEKEIRKSEERLHTILESSPIGISIFSLETNRRVYANPAMVELFGADSVEQMLVRDGKETCANPLDLDQLRPTDPGNFTEAIEVERLRMDGMKWWCRTHRCRLMLEGQSSVIYWNYDITERKHAEEEVNRLNEELERRIQERTAKLVGSESRLNEAQEIGKIGYWCRDIASGKVDWSDQTYRIYGRSRETFEPTLEKVKEFIHPDDFKKTTKAIDDAIAGNKDLSIDFRIILPDNLEKWVHVVGKIDRSEQGAPTLFEGTLQDISERKKIEEALLESQTRFRLAFENVAVGNILIDDKGIIEIFNSAAENIFGYTADEVVGRNVNYLMPEADRNRHDGYIRKYLETGEAMVIGKDREVTGLRKNGEEFPMHLGVGEMKMGDKVSFVGSISDLTKTKALEAQLAQAQKMEAVGQLMGGIAHDFNNMLAVIIGNLELAGNSEAVRTDSLLHELVTAALDAGERAGSMTNQLLSFSRLQTLTPETKSATETVQESLKLIERALGENIEIETQLPQEILPIRIDAAMFGSALLNLSLNARDAMPNGGKLIIKMKAVAFDKVESIEGPVPDHGHYVLITVSDTGKGIDEHDLDRVIEPFFTTKQFGHGSGFGLSMVFGFIKQSGGHMKITSEKGRGTTVSLYLPLVDELNEMVQEKTKIDSTYLSKRREKVILVVEDDLNVLRTTRKILMAEGYEVLEAPDGPSAGEILQERSDAIDMVFSDVVMPKGMSGMELAEWVRQKHKHIKVLLTSGYPDVANQDPNNTSRFKILAKPYKREQLVKSIEDAFNS